MQTFLPYENFNLSAGVLDNRRLGKQRVENLQIMKSLCGLSKGWGNHPAVRMWRGYEDALMTYQFAICSHWIFLGFNDTCLEKTAKIWTEYMSGKDYTPDPHWLGEEKFHASHRSNLLRKDPEWYGQFEWEEPDDLPYYWPV